MLLISIYLIKVMRYYEKMLYSLRPHKRYNFFKRERERGRERE